MTSTAVLAVVAALAQPTPVRLTVTVDEGPGEPVQVGRLWCGAARTQASGYLHSVGARRACRTARRRAQMLTHAPDQRHRACDQTFGGPETARVSGRIGTQLVRRALKRSDGCAIAEWDALVPLVPPHQIKGLTPPPSG